MAEPDPLQLIEEIVQSSGLPAELWDCVEPIGVSKIQGFGFRCKPVTEPPASEGDTHTHLNLLDTSSSRYYVRISWNILATMRQLSVRQILGLATVIRTQRDRTAMVSNAEAIKVILDESHIPLMMLLLRLLKSGADNLYLTPSNLENYDFERYNSGANRRHRSGAFLVQWKRERSHRVYQGSDEQAWTIWHRRWTEELADPPHLASETQEDQQQKNWLELNRLLTREQESERQNPEEYEQRYMRWERREKEAHQQSSYQQRSSQQWSHQQSSYQQRSHQLWPHQPWPHQQWSGTLPQRIPSGSSVSLRETKEAEVTPTVPDKQASPQSQTTDILPRELASQSLSTPLTQIHWPKSYYPTSAYVWLQFRGHSWGLITDDDLLRDAFVYLLALLHLLLGGTSSTTAPDSVKYVKLKNENALFFREQNRGTAGTVPTSQCWRSKLSSGNVLIAPPRKDGGLRPGSLSSLPRDFSDGLHLTAAALWSLFDNALEREPGCRCTFRSEGGDYIQCQSKHGQWFIWHVSETHESSGGQCCNKFVQIALRDDEIGERLVTTSPCILGWPASSRRKPHETMWTNLEPSKVFRNKTLTKYTIKELQFGAQLSVPTVVAPQVGLGVTFAKMNYGITNSIDGHSALALAQAAATVVLLYDETRGIHLTLDGTDLIEMICVQELRTASYDTALLPDFAGPTASTRLEAWQKSSFIALAGVSIPGDQLVRQAVRKVIKFLEKTKDASRQDDRLLYWPLGDVLRGHSALALKAPRLQYVTWHPLAVAVPPLVLVVGSLDTKFLSIKHSSWTVVEPEDKELRTRTRSRILCWMAKFLNHDSISGGLFFDREVMTRWLYRCGYSEKLNVGTSQKRILFNDQAMANEHVYKFEHGVHGSLSAIACACVTGHDERCLHYIE